MANQPMTQDEYDALIYAGSTAYEDDEDETPAPEPVAKDEETEAVEAETEEVETETKDDAPEGEPEAEEAEAEAEETETPVEEPETEEPEVEAPKVDNRIPKTRFDEVNERRKAAERRATELEAQLAQRDPAKAVNFDFDGKEQEYAQKVLDGDFEAAMTLRREIRGAEQAAFEVMAESKATTVNEANRLQSEFDGAVLELNAKYPVFDPEVKGFDKDLVDEALELHEGFVRRGYEPAAALRKAVRYVAVANGLEVAGEEPAAEEVSLKDAKPVPKKGDLKRKLEAAEKQPPRQRGRGAKDEAAIDLESISEEEFDALPESKLRALRGDMRL